jgi:hypothetical protein
MNRAKGRRQRTLSVMQAVLLSLLLIIQSGGTGKTRMAIELGKEHPMLYVCLRKPGHLHARQGYPLADQQVVTYFQDGLNRIPSEADEFALKLTLATARDPSSRDSTFYSLSRTNVLW